jgi:hypothetical protein
VPPSIPGPFAERVGILCSRNLAPPRPVRDNMNMDATPPPPLAPEDFYFDGPNLVFTAAYHLKRGSCCGSGCRHCPFGAEEPVADPEG